MHKIQLGSWTFESGNACHATLEFMRPTGVAVSFTWKSPLSPEDEDAYKCLVLRDAARLAVEHIDTFGGCRAALLELESEGLVARVGVNEYEDTIWSLTEKGRAMQAAPTERALIRLWSKIRSTVFDWF